MEVTSLSYSKIATLLRCPKQFEFRYIEQSPAPLPGRLVAGRVYHHCLAVAASRKQIFGELMSDEEIADIFSSQWDKELSDKLVYDELGDEKVEATVVDFDEDPGELKDGGIKLAQIYVRTVLPSLDIISIEKRLECEVDGIKFVGYPDFILVDKVIDHKLRKRKASQDDINNDIQLPSYAMLLGRPITGEIHQAITTKEKKIEIAEKIVEQEDIERMKELVRDCWGIIQNGIFPRNQTWWGCGPNCPYYLECLHPNF